MQRILTLHTLDYMKLLEWSRSRQGCGHRAIEPPTITPFLEGIMDQPGNSHYALHMSQQALNGHGGYYGRGNEANGCEGNSSEANGYNDGIPADYAAASVPEARTAADASIGTSAQASADGMVPDEAVTDDGALDATRDDTMPTDTAQANTGQGSVGLGSVGQDAGRPATDVAPGGLEGQDATGTAGGEPTASRGSVNGTSTADRMRELLARSVMDDAAIDRATATALDGIRQRLAGVSATLDGLTAGLSTLSTQLSTIDGRLASTEGRVAALDTRFERLDERLDDQYDRAASIDGRLASIGEQVIALGGQLTDAIAPLADELRARPGRAEIEEMVTKIVEAAHSDLSTRLTSLEDTVLTLAEALLRPAPGHTPPGY
jgi:hypothetical protein